VIKPKFEDKEATINYTSYTWSIVTLKQIQHAILKICITSLLGSQWPNSGESRCRITFLEAVCFEKSTSSNISAVDWDMLSKFGVQLVLTFFTVRRKQTRKRKYMCDVGRV